MVWEAISKTRKSVSSCIQTPRSWSKKLGCASFFQPTSQGLDILMKHSFSCLIYYINNLFQWNISIGSIALAAFVAGSAAKSSLSNLLQNHWQLPECSTNLHSGQTQKPRSLPAFKSLAAWLSMKYVWKRFPDRANFASTKFVDHGNYLLYTYSK